VGLRGWGGVTEVNTHPWTALGSENWLSESTRKACPKAVCGGGLECALYLRPSPKLKEETACYVEYARRGNWLTKT